MPTYDSRIIDDLRDENAKLTALNTDLRQKLAVAKAEADDLRRRLDKLIADAEHSVRSFGFDPPAALKLRETFHDIKPRKDQP